MKNMICPSVLSILLLLDTSKLYSVVTVLRNITGSVQDYTGLYRAVQTLVMARTGTDTIIVTGALEPPPPSDFYFSL